MLHKNMLVAWESFPPQLTIQLAGHIGEDEYMAFGVSGEQGKSSMKGGDVAVAYMDEYLGHVEDYNLTARLFRRKHLLADRSINPLFQVGLSHGARTTGRSLQ